MGAGEWILMIFVLGAVAVAAWFVWRSNQWEDAAQRERRRADEAEEEKLRREDLQRQEGKTDDELLEDFVGHNTD